MSDAIHESHKFAEQYINVKYRNADPVVLANACEEWLIKYDEFQIRRDFSGSRMLVSQLDLFDRAKDRVHAVRQNCLKIANIRA